MDGAIVQVSADRIIYRASALGGCSRALLAARLEYEPIAPPAAMQKVFDAGHDAEDAAIEALRNQTRIIVSDREKAVEVKISGRISVVGHIDGVNNANRMPVEVKSQNQAAWDAFEEHGWESGFFPRYKWQVSTYMHAEGQPLYMARYNRDTGELKLSVVDEPFYTLAEIRHRVLTVEAVAQSGVLLADCDLQMYPCPYFYTHDETDMDLVDDEVVDQLARDYKQAKKDEARGKGQAEAIRKVLREKAGVERKIKTTHGTKVTFYDAKNPPSLNKAALEAEMAKKGMKFADFQTSTVSERIRVTIPEDTKKEGVDGESPATD